ncbi:hypothetical protein YSY43_20160 [Paenibacillus sp. YSY-4.3]
MFGLIKMMEFTDLHNKGIWGPVKPSSGLFVGISLKIVGLDNEGCSFELDDELLA